MTITETDRTIQGLEQAVAGDPRLLAVVGAAQAFGVEQLAVVGSYVRDRLLGTQDETSNTYQVRSHLRSSAIGGMEIVGEGITGEIAEHVAAMLGGSVDALTAFDFVIKSDAGLLNIGAARTSIYRSGDGIPFHMGASLVEDLARRDFTINAMAVRVIPFDGASVFFDPFGGRRDLENSTVRALSADHYLTDAALIIRAEREVARFGYRLDPRDRDLIRDAVEQQVSALAPVRVGAEFRMAWAVLDRHQMTQVMLHLAEVGFYRALDEELAETSILRISLADPGIPPQVEETHSTADVAATFSGLLLSSGERVHEVAERLGLTGAQMEMFRDTSELLHTMHRLLDPEVPHSRRHRKLLHRRVLSVIAADLALNGGNTDLSQVSYYMERMGRYGPDYNFGQNRINLHLELSDVIGLGATEEQAVGLMVQLVNAKLDHEVGYQREDEVGFITERLSEVS